MRLKRPAVQENGELCEWQEEHKVWDIHHRHVSHLYGLFPSNQFVGKADMMQACQKVLESHGDGGTGWSLAWKISFAWEDGKVKEDIDDEIFSQIKKY